MRYECGLSKSTLFALIISLPCSKASPINSYPLSLQYPPLIQYGQPFTYQLPQNTFTSTDNTELVYTADNLPSWMSFNSSSRVFFGTAPPGPSKPSQTENIWFNLIATDASGQLSLNSSFAISNIDFPTISNFSVLTTALQNAGSVASLDTLVLTPGNEFSFAIPKTIFTSPSEPPISQFYSLLTLHNPLPNWIAFNADTFTFFGNAPPIISSIAPSQTYSISLFAIQVPGFSSAKLDFNMVVGPHNFSTKVLSVNQTVQPGNDFFYELPLNDIFVDTKPVTASAISNVTTNSSWINSNPTSLNGKVPENFVNSTYKVKLTNSFSDVVEIQLNLNTKKNMTSVSDNKAIFTKSSLADVNATLGEFFSFTLPNSAVNFSLVADDITFESSPIASWLSFHTNNLTLIGVVPEAFIKTQITLVNGNSYNDKLVFTLVPTDKPTPSSTPASSESEITTLVSKGISKKTIAIICGVVIPISLIIIALLLFLLCCCRGRKDKTRIWKTGPRGKISRPILSTYPEKGIHFERPVSDLPNTPNSKTNFFTASTEKLHDSYTTVADEEPDSPRCASKLNMYRLENPQGSQFSAFQASPASLFSGKSDDTHIGEDARIEAMQKNIMEQLERTSNTSVEIPPAVVHRPSNSHSPVTVSPLRSEFGSADGVVISKPRNSWRKSSQPSHRWHPRNQGGSLATIATNELPSVRMVSHSETTTEKCSPVTRHFSDSSEYSGSSHYSQSPKSKHTSNSASIGSYSSSDMSSGTNDFGTAVPYSNNMNSIVELPGTSSPARIDGAGPSNKPLNRSEETSETDMYCTASSGDMFMDAESSEDEGEVLKPYINARGQWEWEMVPVPGPIVYGQAVDHSFQRTSAYSDAQTITNASSPVTMEHALSSATLRHQESTKLVSFTKERSTSIITTNLRKDSVASGIQGESAEFSFAP